MPSIGPLEVVVVLIIALLVLGPKRLPELGRSLGSGMREFKDSIAGRPDAAPQGPDRATRRRQVQQASADSDDSEATTSTPA